MRRAIFLIKAFFQRFSRFSGPVAQGARILYLAVALLLIGAGIGGMLRPEMELSPIRIVHVSLGPQGKPIGQALEFTPASHGVGCTIDRRWCVCDAPQGGSVRFPAVVECDAGRTTVWWDRYEALPGWYTAGPNGEE